MSDNGRALRRLTICLVAGMLTGVAGFFLTASDVGFLGEPNGPLLGLWVVLLLAGAAAFAIGVLGLLVLGILAVVRSGRGRGAA